ncbi:hypothetical protein [Segetibacter koreensis]|uniref:hypothetical protein n=1 Tax=Segetibacter koreensis TaxID=398037 RepID=UPI0012FBBA0A|nr:hypothetical protein [Segetibacter koreensis]
MHATLYSKANNGCNSTIGVALTMNIYYVPSNSFTFSAIPSHQPTNIKISRQVLRGNFREAVNCPLAVNKIG